MLELPANYLGACLTIRIRLFPASPLATNSTCSSYFEEYSQVTTAIAREKEIKAWRREKKLNLILADNPDWADLSSEWGEDPSWKAISSEELRRVLKKGRLIRKEQQSRFLALPVLFRKPISGSWIGLGMTLGSEKCSAR